MIRLTIEQKEAFRILAPLSSVISEWIWAKACFLNKPYTNIFTSVVLADLIYSSNFLSHPISKQKFNTRDSNNLTLIEKDKYWEGRANVFEGKSYKSYRDNLHFASDYSDIFSNRYDEALAAECVSQQVDLLSLKKPNPIVYNREMKNFIINYGLGDFDG